MVPLSLEDCRQVENLLLRYAFTIDNDPSPEAAILEIFTEDAVLVGPKGHHVGIPGLKEFAARVGYRPEVQKRHLVTNVVVDGAGDRATIQGYFINWYSHRRPGMTRAERMPVVESIGTYDCVAVRTGGRWRLQVRNVKIDSDD